jgi:hypothetical protein
MIPRVFFTAFGLYHYLCLQTFDMEQPLLPGSHVEQSQAMNRVREKVRRQMHQ